MFIVHRGSDRAKWLPEPGGARNGPRERRVQARQGRGDEGGAAIEGDEAVPTAQARRWRARVSRLAANAKPPLKRSR